MPREMKLSPSAYFMDYGLYSCKTSLKHFRDMQQYTSNSDREISNYVLRMRGTSSQVLSSALAPPGPSFWSFPTTGTSDVGHSWHCKRASIHVRLVPGGLHVYTGQVCCMGQVRLPAAPVPPSPS